MRRQSEILGIFAVFLLGMPVAAQECNRLQSASPDELVSFLNGRVSDQANAACVAFAINTLGGQRYEPAIPVLTKLLDFRWPINAHQKQKAFVLEHDGTSIYPAATALEQIGRNALPAVLNAIKAASSSREAGEVAVSIWMTIYKNQAPTGVALLKQEADQTKDPATRQRLGWAAFKALGWCASSYEAQCKAAANARFSN
jgi:hypothetical protein